MRAVADASSEFLGLSRSWLLCARRYALGKSQAVPATHMTNSDLSRSLAVAGGRRACADAGVLCGVWPGLGAICVAAAGSGVGGPQSHPLGHCGHARALVSRNYANTICVTPSPFSVRSLGVYSSLLGVLFPYRLAALAVAPAVSYRSQRQVQRAGRMTRHLSGYTSGIKTHAISQLPLCGSKGVSVD